MCVHVYFLILFLTIGIVLLRWFLKVFFSFKYTKLQLQAALIFFPTSER